MKHLDVTVKAPKVTTIPLPAWWGHATTVISALADDPHAADGFQEIDMDAVHRDVER